MNIEKNIIDTKDLNECSNCEYIGYEYLEIIKKDITNTVYCPICEDEDYYIKLIEKE